MRFKDPFPKSFSEGGGVGSSSGWPFLSGLFACSLLFQYTQFGWATVTFGPLTGAGWLYIQGDPAAAIKLGFLSNTSQNLNSFL